VPSVIRATGSLVEKRHRTLHPGRGKVSNIYVNAGQFVGTGAVIGELDDSSPRQEVNAANAAVKQALAGVRQAEAKLGLGPNADLIPRLFPKYVPPTPFTNRPLLSSGRPRQMKNGIASFWSLAIPRWSRTRFPYCTRHSPCEN
jgi:hypothetical protein